MPRYAITEKAGPFVAAHRNTGVGTVLELSQRQAEHEVRLGSLVALTTATSNPEVAIAVHQPDDSEQPTALQAEDADLQAPQPRKPKRSAT